MPDEVNSQPMPARILAGCTVSDPSEHVEGWLGRAGGSFDESSGVLELVYAPYSAEELGEPNDEMGPWEHHQYAATTTRFVEVERLLTVLSTVATGDASDVEFWRTVLAEKLDAHQL